MSSSPAVHILLVEDSEDDAFFFRWTLRKCATPTEVVHVADGAAALEHLRAVVAGRRRVPDAVFLDLKMPSFSGFEILEWLQQHAATLRLNVVVLSGSELGGDIARAKALGAMGYLVKPISPEHLSDHLQQIAAKSVASP